MHPTSQQKKFLILLAIVLLALLLRILFGDSFNLDRDDWEYYFASKKILETGNLFSAAKFFHTHFIFRYLGIWLSTLCWKLFGDSLLSLAFFHLLASVGLVWLTILFSQRLTKSKGVFEATFFAALIPVGIQVGLGVNPDQLLAFFSCLTLFLLLRAGESEKRNAAYFIAGLVFCFAAFTKEESGQHFLPLVALLLYQEVGNVRSIPWKKLSTALLLFGGPVAIAYLSQIFLAYHYLGDPFAQFHAIHNAYEMWMRVAPTDPEGRPWSYMYFIRRIVFPFGPLAFIFPLTFIGLIYYIRDGRNRGLLVWLSLQFAMLLIVGNNGFGQDRRLQLMIPCFCMLAGYGMSQWFSAPRWRWSVASLLILSMAYLDIGKFNLRADAAPRAPAVCRQIVALNLKRVYAHETILYYLRQLYLTTAPGEVVDLKLLNESSESVVTAVIQQDRPPQGWRVIEILFEPHEEKNILNDLAAPLRKYRKEYPPYILVTLDRI